ncbi:TetR family transcriptional regulator [Achromobacter xylosoxidans]|jgi:AcrR family transcriptional regulator|nr:TetR family transcriptional regulator [Achromobacter xylosoxidans]
MSATESLPPAAPAADPGRRERKRLQTLDHLARTAFGLFEAQGYDAVTMEQIAAAADVAKGTLYNHFPVKEALLAHHLHGELAASLAALWPALRALPSFAARLTRILRASADWSESHRAYLGPYLRYRLAHAQSDAARHPRSGLQPAYASLIAEAQAAGQLRADLSAEQLAHHLQFLHLGAMLRWLDRPGASLRDEYDAALSLFLGGAAKEAP